VNRNTFRRLVEVCSKFWSFHICPDRDFVAAISAHPFAACANLPKRSNSRSCSTRNSSAQSSGISRPDFVRTPSRDSPVRTSDPLCDGPP